MGGSSKHRKIDPPTPEEAAADAEADKTFNRFKHWPYGLAVMVVGQFLAINFIIWLTETYLGQKPEPEFTAAHSRVGFALAAYFAIMLGVRFPEGGTFVLYEMLWGCNTSMMSAIVGIALGRPMLIGAATTAVLIDQICWYVDCGAYLLIGKFPIGAAAYMAKPDCSMLTRLTSLHHLWFLPLCFYVMHDFGGLRPYSFIPGFALTAFLAFYCRLLTPKTVPLSAKQQRALGLPHRTINVNACYAFWADVPIGFLHWCDNSHPLIYLLYLSVCGNAFLCGPPYLVARLFAPA